MLRLKPSIPLDGRGAEDIFVLGILECLDDGKATNSHGGGADCGNHGGDKRSLSSSLDDLASIIGNRLGHRGRHELSKALDKASDAADGKPLFSRAPLGNDILVVTEN